MGNKLAYGKPNDCEGPGDTVAFFQDLNVKWLSIAVTKIKEIKQSEFSLSTTDDKLKWNHYFKIFSEIKEKMVSDNQAQQKLIWHPVTHGYSMGKEVAVEEPEIVEEVQTGKVIADDHTDDDPSELSDDGSDDSSGSDNDDEQHAVSKGQQRNPATPKASKEQAMSNQKDGFKVPSHWNSSLVSPIFFGYNTVKAVEIEKAAADEKANIKLRENRAISKAQDSRNVVIDSLERAMKAQEANRLKKIEQCVEKYQTAKAKSEADFAKNKEQMPEVAFDIYKNNYDQAMQAAAEAFENEVGDMRDLHEEKTFEDSENLRKKREDLEAFKDAENQELPAAEHLEVFARVEVSRCIEQLTRLSHEMDRKRAEYVDMKQDYEKLVTQNEEHVANNNKKGNSMQALRQIAEVKSMVAMAQTSMRESKRHVEDGLVSLEDAEILLDRAVRMHAQQDQLLPLFTSIAHMTTTPPGSSNDSHSGTVQTQSHSEVKNTKTNNNTAGKSAAAAMTMLERSALPSQCSLNILIIAVALLMKSTFDQKYNFLIRLFDSSFIGTFRMPFIVSIVDAVQQALYTLQYIPYIVNKEDVVSTLTRTFLSLNLNPKVDYLTEYEVKQCILTLVSHSDSLTRVLGISMRTSLDPPSITFDTYTNSYMSTYQRNKMSSLTLLTKSMINLNTCKYQLHYQATQYRPLLAPLQKQAIHERALNMGVDDPLKPDYTKFLVKPKKKEKYRVDPLNNGHLANTHYLETVSRQESALKIQTLFRAYQDKKIAELAAKYLAFTEAKMSAIKEMKLKIIREFKKRESSKGMGKMKWDAQVRMKQAKLRTLGQAVNRGETVMVMIEESINTAKEGIEERFVALEKKEKFGNLNFNKERDTYEPSLDDKIDVESLFDMLPRVPLISNHLLTASNKKQDGMEGDKTTADGAAPVDGLLAEGAAESKGDGAGDQLVVHGGNSQQQTQSVLKSARIRDYIEGTLSQSIVPHSLFDTSDGTTGGELITRPNTALTTTTETTAPQIVGAAVSVSGQPRGETDFELELSQLMSASEPTDIRHLFTRLRMLQISLTEFKVTELLSEMPSKRLFLLYIASLSDEALESDLTKHFKFKKHQVEVVKHFRKLVTSDTEHGLLSDHLLHNIQRSENGLFQLFLSKMNGFISTLQAQIELKLQTNNALTETIVIHDEMNRMETIFNKYKSQCADILSNIQVSREKFQRVMLSYHEISAKLRCIKRIKDKHESHAVNNSIPLSIRQDWLTRITSALKLSETTSREIVDKYTEISNVCKEFLSTAQSDAVIIVNEIHTPKFMKTVPVLSEHVVIGRAQQCGRGLEDGKYFTYEMHNIVYTVALDYHGVFNGSDEYAMKAAGHERIGSQEYFRLNIHKLRVPLIATFDIQGYRVVAMSKLPVQNIMFNEEGEVRKVSEDLVHGVAGNGDSFINKSRMLQSLLRLAGTRLNLCDHICKGANDISSSTTCTASELRVYKSSTDEFYCSDFWRTFPPEIPSVTTHLLNAPREQSIYWRQLRPEFVTTYGTALSSDAGCALTIGVSDARKHYDNVVKATEVLIETVVPNFVEDLLNRDYSLPVSEGLGLDLTNEMHCRGINMRHMGLMRSLLWHSVPGTVSAFHHESIIRTSVDLRREVSNGDKIRLEGVIYTIEETRKNTITSQILPLNTKYLGESLHGLTITAGRTANECNSTEVGLLLLGEMIARTMKQVIRYQMRVYNKNFTATSTQFYSSLIVEYCNFISGSNENSDSFFQNALFDGVRERFGPVAIRYSEKYTIQRTVQPIIPYIVNRLLTMLGAKLTLACQSEFAERPIGFIFILHDIVSVTPVVKHNIPILAYADALVISHSAMGIESEAYTHTVVQDRPALFYTLSERKGCRQCDNKGSLGSDFNGNVNRGCDLEHPGPVPSDKYIRSYSFKPLAKSFIDIKYHKDIVPESLNHHFSMEVYFNCTSGANTVRTILNSGRYNLFLSRDNYVSFTLIDGNHELNLQITPVVYNRWHHLALSYDGTTVRCYMDDVLVSRVEVEELMRYKRMAYEAKITAQKADIRKEEDRERHAVVDRSRQEAASYFQTRDGISVIKNTSRDIMESQEFQDENIGADCQDQTSALKVKRNEAIRRAKEKYIQEVYDKNIREIAERFRQLVYDLDDRVAREEREGKLRSYDALRIGAAVPNASSREGSNYFHGQLSCVSIYPHCLSSDRINAHFLSATADRRRDAQRLHSIAASKYEAALKLASVQDSAPLNGYAKSLCSYLRMECEVNNFHQGKTVGKGKIMTIMEEFKGKRLAEGIAEIMREVPKDVEFADLITQGFLAIKSIDRNFFSKSLCLSRKELTYLPFDFALTDANNPPEAYEAAAFIFQQVVKDHELMFIYGELDLRWLPELENDKLVIALVKQAHEDKHLRMVKVAEMFYSAGHEEITVMDDDIGVLSQNLSISEGFDLSHCTLLTDTSMTHVNRMNNLRILNINYCARITDRGMKHITSLCPLLEVLSLEGCVLLTDAGLMLVAEKCTSLAVVNVNKCINISADSLNVLAKNNRKLSTFHCAGTQMDDSGLSQFSSVSNAAFITSIDLSFCHNITDSSIMSMAESCVSLRHVNLAGLSRVSDIGVGKICSNCWHLQSLNVEDIFLLHDRAFWFNPTLDGRKAARENMLTSLTTLNLTDCVHVSDRGIEGLAERCRKLEHLTLRGCDKLTDKALAFMCDKQICTESTNAMCETIKTLSLANTTGFSAKGLSALLATAVSLESIDLTGHGAVVTDKFLHELTQVCKTIQRITLTKCALITDASLCSFADYLWLEHIDISYCQKITDSGVDVLSEACTGLQTFVAKRCGKLTSRSVLSIVRNCTTVQLVDFTECVNVDRDALAGVKSKRVNFKLLL